MHFHTGQPPATAKDWANGVLGDIAAVGASAAWSIANFVLDECGLTHPEENLQDVENFGDKSEPRYVSNF